MPQLEDDLLPALTSEFAERLPELSLDWQSIEPDSPTPLVVSEGLASELGFAPEFFSTEAGLRFLLGNQLPSGSRPVAQLYAGHQFGVFVPRLGDGRALLLGELRAPGGDLVDLHLKGSGRTPFARADGFAAVGPMLREFLMSEAMHALGIPTTRALAVVGTGRRVQRDELHPGAVLVRTAQSHLRVGSFQYALAQNDLELLRRLADYAIERHFPNLVHADAPYTELLRAVVERQAHLIAQWMLVGFVHGVMNTDNVTISGETIDYGPCAFIGAYDPAAVFSSIDHKGRYAYGNQPQLALWNLTRFGETLLPLISSSDNSGDVSETAIAAAREALEQFSPIYERAWLTGMRAKLGLSSEVSDEMVTQITSAMLSDLETNGVDYTGFFRALTDAARGDETGLRTLCSPEGSSDSAQSWPRAWFDTWRELSPDGNLMAQTNPIYIPRGHLTDEVLDAAEAGDMAPFERLLSAVSHPFDARPEFADIALPSENLGGYRTYCGT